MSECPRCGSALLGATLEGLCPGCVARVMREAPTLVMPTEKPGDRIGRYKLLEKVGEGGCGVIYVAEQLEPVKRRVALKVIKLGMDTRQVVARFEAERQALAMMDHPNIAKVLDAGTTELGRPFFVMELVRGIRLTDYCDQTQLSTRKRLDLFIKICQAVQHAHQKGIIHRDIKPSNILVTLHDGVPVPKVIDFGIAKATEGRLTDATVYTQLHQFIGTPAYMSPEQAEMSGLDIDTRSDIYSLGVLLYELLAGSTPFDPNELMASGIDAMRKTIREQDPPKPSTRLATLGVADLTTTAKRRSVDTAKLVHQLKGDLDWIIMKCLDKDRQRRYDTANGLAMDIQRHLNHEPVLARPPSSIYRFHKTFRRNKLVFTSATLVVTALIIGIVASTWQMSKARSAHRQTNAARLGEQQQRLEAQAAHQAADAERERANLQAGKASASERHTQRLLYAADMNLAQQAVRLNNIGRTRRLLDRHRPQPGEEDLRGWEWRYLWQLTQSSAWVTLTNRPPPVRGFSVDFSPDGSRLAVGWSGGQVDLWDVPARQWIRALTDHGHARQGQVAFSRIRNRLVATSTPNTVTLYDLDSGRESIVWRGPDTGSWVIRDLSFSQDDTKVVIYAGAGRDHGDAAWVVHAASGEVESQHPADWSDSPHHGAARLSPDNRLLFLSRSDSVNYRYHIQCLDLATGEEVWQTAPERDFGLSALAVSPDGQMLASGSGFEDPTIRVWDAATGRLVVRLDGHTAWVCKLVFTSDGTRLVSAASDQSIRFWDAATWTEVKVLRGHTDEVHAVAVSIPVELTASTGKDGSLLLWKEEELGATDGYTRLPEVELALPLDRSRLLLLRSGQPLKLLNLERDTPIGLVPNIASSHDLLGWEPDRFSDLIGQLDGKLLCHWNGIDRILVHELQDAQFVARGAIPVDSGIRPTGLVSNPARQLLAWTEPVSPMSVFLASLKSPGRRIELRGDVPGLIPFGFSEDGVFLMATTRDQTSVRVWNVEDGQMVASLNELVRAAAVAAAGRVLVAALHREGDHEIGFFDLVDPSRPARRVAGFGMARRLAVSPDGELVASSTYGGLVRLFDPFQAEVIATLHGHMNAAFGVAFSPDGRRLISTSGGREAVKLWDVSTRQELLTLTGGGSFLVTARWSADGNVIIAGPPQQAWRAPSWEEIAEVEGKAGVAVQQP